MNLSRVRKCIAAGITAGVAAITQAVNADGSISSSDWFVIGGAVLVAGYLTWQIPNAPAKPNGD